MWLVPSKYANLRDSATSLPPAFERSPGAARRRSAERDQRDLFAPPPSDFGLTRPKTSAPPPSAGGYGARNENSVLFTVEEIRNSARPAPPPEEDREQEDGVIDLQSLTFGKAPPSPAVPVFGAESSTGAFSSEIAGQGASGERGAWRLGAFTTKQIAIAASAAACGLLFVVGLFLVFRGEEPDMSRATTSLAATAEAEESVAAPVAAPPAQTPESTGPAEETVAAAAAVAEATGSTDEGAERAAKPKGKRRGKGGKSHAKPAKKAKAAAPAQSPAPKAKKADPCKCRGDFECNLRCAAKGK